MILGDSEIKRMMAEGYFPAYPKLLINPASLNVRIGTSFLVPQRKRFGSVALGDEVKYKKIVLQKGKAFKLRPGQFALATTIESINLPLHLAAFVQGRSSIGRAGLTVQNAGFIDPWFSWTHYAGAQKRNEKHDFDTPRLSCGSDCVRASARCRASVHWQVLRADGSNRKPNAP